MQHFSNFANPLINCAFWVFGQFKRRRNIVVNGEAGVVDKLLVHHRDVAFTHRDVSDVFAIYNNFAAGGWFKPRH